MAVPPSAGAGAQAAQDKGRVGRAGLTGAPLTRRVRRAVPRKAAPRPYPERILEPWYPADREVSRFRTDGRIRRRGGGVFISEVLSGELIWLVELTSGAWLARFVDIELGMVDRRGERLLPFAAARPDRRKRQERINGTVSNVSGPPCR